MNENSKLITRTMGALYPIIQLFSIYIILNGHLSPGGGFQGGALIMSVFICSYIANPQDFGHLHQLHRIEKIALLLIYLVAIGFLTTLVHRFLPQLNIPYLIIMNLLISLKVASGLTLIFYHFIQDEEAL